MKFPISMLRDFVDTRLDAEQIGDLLTMAGFELEGIEDVEGEAVLDIKVVSNRGDGLSVFGLSREVLAKDAAAVPTEHYRRVASGYALGDEQDTDVAARTRIDVETEACARYACRLFEATNSESPAWLQQRLRQCGQRPLGLLVDLSNYVMVELGQPLHAFDHDTLDEGRIVVRGANPGERLTTLNGIEHALQPHHMVICDARKAVALAGVMGGAETEVGPSTKRVLLESAHFAADSVRRTRKELGLNTEASYRFERSVDPEGVVRALNRFAELLEANQPGSVRISGVLDRYPKPPARTSVSVRVSRAERLLGMPIGAAEAGSYLERLGFAVGGDGEPYHVESPTWRPDIVREEDLIEEIGRVHGYERIPAIAPAGTTPIGGVRGFEARVDRLRAALLREGLVQTVSHSLRDRHPLDSPNLEPIGPKSPSSPEMAWLRTSLWPCLSDAALRNGARDVHLFEIGRVHGRRDGGFVEGRRAAILTTGALLPEHWVKSPPVTTDFYALKGMVTRCLRAMGHTAEWGPESADPRLHPTRQARVTVGGLDVGVAGQIHPDVAESCDLPADTFLAALDLDALAEQGAADVQLVAISRNPAVRRDISILIATDVPYARIEADVREACGPELERLWLFDRYVGANIPEGHHSLSLALQLRKMGANFTDEEANQVRDRAVRALESLGATQR